jgi:methylmalonyl-CoA mutase N-terminal domain/subunit
MQVLFAGIPLDKVTTSMTINAPAAVLLAMYLALADEQGVPYERLGGTVQNDVLKEYVARGTYIFPPRQSVRLVTDIFEFCSQRVPNWNTISISGYHIREAGSTAVQEVAFTLANAAAYVQAAIDRGLAVDTFGPRLSFFFNSQMNFFEEIAKFRAARRLWAKIMRDRFGARDPRSWMLRFHTQTAGSALTAQQPENNVVRVALQALAAVLGGTQSLHTSSKDEALALPSEESVRTALRTQQIIAHESGVADTIDPLGGSYYVETLTDRIERDAADYLDRLHELGGAVEAIERGYMQREIHESAYRFQRDVEAGRRTVVGVNAYAGEEEPPAGLHRVDPQVEQAQLQRLTQVRAGRDGVAVEQALDALRQGAQGSDNLMPLCIAAVKARATLGEICAVLRGVFGEYRAASLP